MFVGVNVAVMSEVPTAPKSIAVPPEIAATDVVADEYVHDPATEPTTVGAVIVAFTSPNVADTFDQLNDGVAFSIVNVAVTDPEE